MEFLLQTDKASMLDEIIDYVKFLQVQVKVIKLILHLGYLPLDEFLDVATQ